MIALPTSSADSRAPSRLASVGRRLMLCALLFVLGTREAAAYTDPGSGALLYQLLIAGFVGLLYHFRRLVGWFRSDKEDSKE